MKPLSDMTKAEFMEYWLKIPYYAFKSDWLEGVADGYCRQFDIPTENIQIMFDDTPRRAYLLECGIKWYGHRWSVDRTRIQESSYEYLKYLKATHELVTLYRKDIQELVPVLSIIQNGGNYNKPPIICAARRKMEPEYS